MADQGAPSFLLSHNELPRCFIQQQSDQQDPYHSVCLPPRLHDYSNNRAVLTQGVTHDFYPFNHGDGAGEIDRLNTANIHEPNAPQPGPTAVPPPVLSDLDGMGSNSAWNAGTGPSEALQTKPCACISCVDIGKFSNVMRQARFYSLYTEVILKEFQCRYPGCSDKIYHTHFANHERSHFRVGGHYLCPEEHCKLTTKRWTDLKRHTASKHCTRSEKKFPCPVLWCKYSGSNGFARKDKLNSHIKAVHHGMTLPGKANQAIKPKVDGGA